MKEESRHLNEQDTLFSFFFSSLEEEERVLALFCLFFSSTKTIILVKPNIAMYLFVGITIIFSASDSKYIPPRDRTNQAQKHKYILYNTRDISDSVTSYAIVSPLFFHVSLRYLVFYVL